MLIMRTRISKYNNSEILVVYVTAEERQNDDIKNQIAAFKKEYKEVTVFVGGNNSIEKAITKIVQERK